MANDLPTIHTHQVYSTAIKVLGMTELQKLYKKSPTQIYRWGRDPDFAVDCERNPLDRIEAMLRRLCEMDREPVARAAVSMLSHAVGCELTATDAGRTSPDKATLAEECLDDLPVVGTYHKDLMDNGATQAQVRRSMEAAIDELRENYYKRCEEDGWTP